MVTLQERITIDMKDAMRAHDELRVSVLRMLIAAVHNKEIAERGRGKSGELSDEEVLVVFRTEVKKRRDGAEGFRAGGRSESAEKEDAERVMVEHYLPADLSDAEIKKLVQPLAEGRGVDDFGRIMSSAMKVVAGRASGDRVGAMVRELLGKN